MRRYQRKREEQINEMVPVVAVFTVLFICIALFNLPNDLAPPFMGLALVPLLLVFLVFQIGRFWKTLLPRKRELVGQPGLWDTLSLVVSILLVAAVVHITGGAESSYKLLFLPTILIFSLRFGVAWGAGACGLAAATIIFYAWQAGADLVGRNPFLEADLVMIGIFFLVNWLVGKSYQELIDIFILLERSEKLAALGEMAATTAHEIRNPLTTLRGFLQVMRSNLQENPGELLEQNEEYFHLMLGEIDRMNKIVSDLLLFARPNPPNLVVTDLGQLVQDMGVLLDSEARMKDVELRLVTGFGPHLVQVDPDQIKQVLHNLARNAYDAMPGGGEFQIKVYRKRNTVHLECVDTGQGIPAEYQQKIFEPFFSLKGKQGGTGLGLAIAQRIIQNQGGSIQVKSQVGQGTAFYIELPVADSKTVEPNYEQ